MMKQICRFDSYLFRVLFEIRENLILSQKFTSNIVPTPFSVAMQSLIDWIDQYRDAWLMPDHSPA